MDEKDPKFKSPSLGTVAWISTGVGAILLFIGYQKAEDFNLLLRSRGASPVEAYILMTFGGLLLLAGFIMLSVAARRQ